MSIEITPRGTYSGSGSDYALFLCLVEEHTKTKPLLDPAAPPEDWRGDDETDEESLATWREHAAPYNVLRLTEWATTARAIARWAEGVTVSIPKAAP